MLSDEQIEELNQLIVPNMTFAESVRLVEAAVLEELGKQDPVAWCFVQNGYTHYTDDKRDWYDAVGIEEVTPLYAAPVVQPDMVLVPREPTEEMAEPHPFSAKRVTYHKTAPVVQTDRATKEYIVQLECAVETLRSNLAAAKRAQPGMVLVPIEPTEAMLAVLRNERGAYGTGEALYADLITAAPVDGRKPVAHPGVATASSEPLDELRRLAAEIGIPFDAAAEAAYRAFVAAAENRK